MVPVEIDDKPKLASAQRPEEQVKLDDRTLRARLLPSRLDLSFAAPPATGAEFVFAEQPVKGVSGTWFLRPFRC